MFATKAISFLCFVSVVVAHEGHEHEQEPMLGPHKSLWYNSLPGDGGTQVKEWKVVRTQLIMSIGRFGVLWYFYLWAY
jgi:hypothetical protein